MTGHGERVRAGPRWQNVEQDEHLARAVDRQVKDLFPPGAVLRAELVRRGDDPAVAPGELMLRVLIPGHGDAGALAAWADDHREQMGNLRRDLSLRLPAARLLEFTFEDPEPGTAPLSMPDDGSLAAEQLSSREIVTRALALLRENYVFPDEAARVAAGIEARLAAGEYDNVDEITLTERLTADLQEASGDRHLRVRLGGVPPKSPPGPGQPGPGHGIPPPRREAGTPGRDVPGPGRDIRGPGREVAPPGDGDGPADHELRRLKMRRRVRLNNFGIRRVERLDGNIGYLDVRGVPPPQHAGPAVAAAMELVAGTSALIIDLRHNHGGSPDGVALWCSYLLREPPQRLNDIFHAGTGETRQFWSYPYLPGDRYLGRPVYVLTSSQTFSGGEDFCYTLQALGRAEVIGETTGGGAHPTGPFPISAAVHIDIPFARSVSPVTGTNWQNTGVVPDTPAPADQAYDVAYAKALRHVLDAGDVPPFIADEARAALAALAGPEADRPTA